MDLKYRLTKISIFWGREENKKLERTSAFRRYELERHPPKCHYLQDELDTIYQHNVGTTIRRYRLWADPRTYLNLETRSMNNLKEILRREDTVIFVGSGLSRWSGLPSWKGLIEELADFMHKLGLSADLVRKEAAGGDLLQAASYGFAKLSKMQMASFIKAACRQGSAQPHLIHQKIVELGSRCFVTTNYDDLIEQSLRRWQQNISFGSPITNRNLTAIADIIQARRTDFIFKPHGDASDIDSIILTREQYRQLLPQGERHTALDALKTLMVTRPVVYIGFGLRDPDFLYLRDIMSNIYTGGNVDHYAIMSDITEDERTYWRETFGVHLISYATKEQGDGTTDHTNLLLLLDQLSPMEHDHSDRSTPADRILALARYAAGLGRLPGPLIEEEFEVSVRVDRDSDASELLKLERDAFDGLTATELLLNGPRRAILVGAPGAGKSHALRQATARLGADLQKTCLEDEPPGTTTEIPILCDLKLYEGSLMVLVNAQLPRSLSVEQLSKEYRLSIYIDSFNEMPREFRENDSYQKDFLHFFAQVPEAKIIIGSRTTDGLDVFDLKSYELSDINESYILAYANNNIGEIRGDRMDDIVSILRRPFYFNLVKSGRASLSERPHPVDIYASFVKRVQNQYETRFSVSIDLVEALSHCASKSLDEGIEAFPALMLTQRLEKLDLQGQLDSNDILNWLISESIVISHPGNKIAFAHQSITEYLAALNLSKLYLEDKSVITAKLSFRRWDQVLYLCAGILADDEGKEYILSVINKDIKLAIVASRYSDYNQSVVVSAILDFLAHTNFYSGIAWHEIGWQIQTNLPVGIEHTDALWTLLERQPQIAGNAATMLVKLCGEQVKRPLMLYFVKNPQAYNFLANGLGPALEPLMTIEDAEIVAGWCDDLENKHGVEKAKTFDGFFAGIEKLLRNIDEDTLLRTFIRASEPLEKATLRRYALAETVECRKNNASLKLSAELLIAGEYAAINNIYFNSSHADNLDWSFFTSAHVDLILERLFDEKLFGFDALKRICENREDLKTYTIALAEQLSGIKKIALLKATGENIDISSALEKEYASNVSSILKEPTYIFRHLDVDWRNHEIFLVSLLRLRDNQLARNIFGGSVPPSIGKLGPLIFGELDWWLEWMLSLRATNDDYWLLEQLGWFVGYHANQREVEYLLGELTKSSKKRANLIHNHILIRNRSLRLDHLDEETLAYLIDDLCHGTKDIGFSGHLLAGIATEEFARERLVPLLRSDTTDRLLQTLRSIGSRLNRRFIADDGSVI